jgi:hypothetical protein
MLTSFHIPICHSYIRFWEVSIQIFLPFLMELSCKTVFCKNIFSLTTDWLFILLTDFLKAKVFDFANCSFSLPNFYSKTKIFAVRWKRGKDRQHRGKAFRKVELCCMILSMVHVPVCLLKPIGRTTPRMNTDRNSELQVIMICQCRLLSINQHHSGWGCW